MFGISIWEFLIIGIVAILVIPVRDWPDVARFIARAIKQIREMVWKLTDAAEDIKEQLDIEKPIAELTQKTMDDVAACFREPIEKTKKKK
ncbi:MAG: twin-arginine translocase TatA/TatE family subunit [Alphaproteobacteria bacterium]|nr:twin-arginine translocase TatA/TatE family subunit [Alphaproteobacteria bacterium]